MNFNVIWILSADSCTTLSVILYDDIRTSCHGFGRNPTRIRSSFRAGRRAKGIKSRPSFKRQRETGRKNCYQFTGGDSLQNAEQVKHMNYNAIIIITSKCLATFCWNCVAFLGSPADKLQIAANNDSMIRIKKTQIWIFNSASCRSINSTNFHWVWFKVPWWKKQTQTKSKQKKNYES